MSSAHRCGGSDWLPWRRRGSHRGVAAAQRRVAHSGAAFSLRGPARRPGRRLACSAAGSARIGAVCSAYHLSAPGGAVEGKVFYTLEPKRAPSGSHMCLLRAACASMYTCDRRANRLETILTVSFTPLRGSEARLQKPSPGGQGREAGKAAAGSRRKVGAPQCQTASV